MCPTQVAQQCYKNVVKTFQKCCGNISKKCFIHVNLYGFRNVLKTFCKIFRANDIKTFPKDVIKTF